MYKILYILVFLISVTDLGVQGEPSLTILKNMNGVEKPAPSILIIKNGKNISLTCKTIDIQNGKETEYPTVLWSRKTNHFHYLQSKHLKWSKNKIFNTTEPSKLSFIPVRRHDQGTYFCTNTKYNLSKSLQLNVQSHEPEKKTLANNRGKRGTPAPEMPDSNLPDYLKDLLGDPQKENNPESVNRFYDQLFKNIDTSSIGSDQPRYRTPADEMPQDNLSGPLRDLVDGIQKNKNNPLTESGNNYYDKLFKNIDTSSIGSYQPRYRTPAHVMTQNNLTGPLRDLVDGIQKNKNNPLTESGNNYYDQLFKNIDTSNIGLYQPQYGQGYNQWGMRTPEPDMPWINFPDPVGDFLDGHRKKNNPQTESVNRFYDQLFKNIDTSNIGSYQPHYPSWPDTPYKNSYTTASTIDEHRYVKNDNPAKKTPSWSDTSYKNPYIDEDFYVKNDHHATKTQTTGNKNHVFYFLAAAGIAILIGVILCFISYRKKSTVREVSNNAIPLPWPNTHLASGTVETVNSTNQTPTPAIIHDENDEGITILTSLIRPEYTTTANRGSRMQPSHLDVPPAYDDSIRNSHTPSAPMISTCDLPPSYNEALANFSIPAPPYYPPASVPSDVTKGTSQNVVRPAPLASDELNE